MVSDAELVRRGVSAACADAQVLHARVTALIGKGNDSRVRARIHTAAVAIESAKRDLDHALTLLRGEDR